MGDGRKGEALWKSSRGRSTPQGVESRGPEGCALVSEEPRARTSIGATGTTLSAEVRKVRIFCPEALGPAVARDLSHRRVACCRATPMFVLRASGGPLRVTPQLRSVDAFRPPSLRAKLQKSLRAPREVW